MFPIRDRLPTRSFPVINYLLIVVNVVAFLWQGALMEAGYAGLVQDFGLVPWRFGRDPVGEVPNIFTSMFMHGGMAHLGGNMLYLWIFGDNVEDAFGRLRYLAFYLLGGIGAALAQMLIDPNSTIPMVGASGAIAAVLAAYVSLYPQSPITVVNPIIPLWLFLGPLLELPAWVVIVFYFFLPNVFQGLSSLGLATQGGVAFFAHIGGFVAGLVLVRFFMAGRQKRQADRWSGWRPPPRRRIEPWDDYGRYR